MKQMYGVTIFLLIISTFACKQENKPSLTMKDVKKLPLRGEKGFNAVIEVPAGTNRKLEIQPDGQYVAELVDGKARVVNFLPYPGNYGFIPSTHMDEARGGDGDALDVIIIAETVAVGTVQEFIPIAVLKMIDEGENDTKIIGVPADPALRVIHATNFEQFMLEYDAAKRIIETWFVHYQGYGTVEVLGWEDEKAALAEIEKWAL
ncbi:MAG: inorganic diphosphatase [Haliscomenobacter sp.]|uniref:inorganic diphosphatase n=1 Tax=Haliscomenobacter sp. TaxID=2717303 RepID=UPI0029AD5B07|nr:inorganic diphosphatase [Haliscomenobacter sp.]MDX2070917.1 inorganic diphosphatase [Haliscomenobacter sp.]